jgi:monoamine oxidase
VLGAGIAGLVAAYELRNAGYKVQVLEYNARAGGRNWTLRGGDRYTELGEETQECRFDSGLYINPGPWRLPYHHRGMLSYCKRLGVALEPFVQINYNAYVHSRKAFGGKPQRLRTVKADYDGHVAELLAKATQSHALDADVTAEDRATLLDSLRFWGALDKNLRFVKGADSNERRGFERDPGGGLSARPVFSEPVALSDLLKSGLWPGIWARAGTMDTLQRQGRRDPSRRAGRHCHVRRCQRRLDATDGEGGLVRLCGSVVNLGPDSNERG